MMRLHEYQTEMAAFIHNRLYQPGVQGAGLFADLGTGKTAATLKALSTLFGRKVINRCLVIAPLRVAAKTWPDEIKLWTPHLTHQSLHGCRHAINRFPRRHIEFQSCDSVHNLIPYAGRWDCVVVDESYNFKCWTTRRMKALRKILEKTPKRVILTGTPTANSAADLHSQIFILDNGEALGRNVTVFRANYMERGGYMGRQWKIRRGVGAKILKQINGLVMRVDAKDHLSMPELIENTIEVPFPACIRAEYNRLKRELYLELEKDRLLVGNAAALYNKLRQYAQGQLYYECSTTKTRKSEVVHSEKIKALKEIVDEMYGKPALVLYQYTHDRDRLIETLGRKACRILPPSSDMRGTLKVFNDWEGGKFKYLVTHPDSVREGLNLQKCAADAIFFGVPDKPNSYLQTRGRLWRQGQPEKVRIHRIIMENTVEGLQVLRLEGKIKDQSEFLDALKEYAKNGTS